MDEDFELQHTALQPARSSSQTQVERIFCVFSLIFFILIILAASLLFVVFFVIKPRKPVFHLHSIHLDSFKIATNGSNKEVYLSPSNASLIFVTQNPNKLGIRYGPSELAVVYDTVPVGVIDVPAFFQPPRSFNVTVPMNASFKTLNLSRVFTELGGNNANASDRIDVQIVGGVHVQGHVLNIPLPKIKVSVDCEIDLNYDLLGTGKGMKFAKTRKGLVLSSIPHFNQKCSFGLCI